MAGRRDDRRRSWGISFWALTTIAICILYPVTAFGLVPVALHHGNTIIQQPRGSARCLSSNKKVRGVETAPSFQWNHACSGHSAIRTPSQLGMLASPLLVDEMLQSASSLLVSAVAEDVASTAAMDPLMVYFWQTVIANGIPAAFAVAVIGFTALQFRGNGKKDNADSVSSSSLGSTIAARQLYDDLYADQDQDPFRRGNRNGMPFFGGNDRNKPKNNKNTGVPKQQYLTVTHLNQKYDSFAYSLTASTQGKAVAAANYRQRAWQRAWNAQYESLPPSVVRELYQLEATFLNSVASKQAELLTYQTQLQKLSMVQQMEKMGMENVYQIDPPTDGWQGMNSTENATSTSSSSSSLSSSKTKSPSVSMSSMTALQASLVTLENDFCRDVMTTVGPTHAASIYAAILGKGSLSMASMSATGVRPLTFLLGGDSDAVDSSSKPSGRVYVTRFPGDPTASQVANLREEVTAIVQNSRQSNGGDRNHNDQVVVVLQTGGGTVTGYGLAAAQLQRLKDANLYLTICVEQVAASGGYMMACIADKIVASPFAVLGSIGVISDIPNVYNRLKQEGIEFQTVTAGK
jgi:Peptidase family S49/Peptidase family S49 N-terminal